MILKVVDWLMAKSRELWFSSPYRIEIREADIADPKPDQIRVRSLFSGISHGTEMLVYRGEIPPGLEPDLPTIEGKFSYPIKYGYANIGQVVRVGTRVADIVAGDIVFALSPHQTEYLVHKNQAWKFPADLDPRNGVFLANLETSIGAVWDSELDLGDNVVVFGLGVVGLLVIQLLKRVGAKKIIAVDPIEHRRQLASKLGATDCLEAGALDFEGRLRELTQGLGADKVIEASGDPRALNTAIQISGLEANIILVSWYGTRLATIRLGEAFHRNRIKIKASRVSIINPELAPRWSRTRRMMLAMELLKELSLKQLITHVFKFEKAADAYRLIDEHPEEVVQVLIEY